LKNTRGDCLTKVELDRLYEFNDKNDNQYFEGVRDGVKFKNFVGVIRIGNTTIEILPKADKKGSNTQYDCDKWQRALLNMLGLCNKLNVDSVSQTNLSKRSNSLLDLYFQIYLNELNQLLHRGLIKRYRQTEGNLNKLKGRLLFSKQISNNLIHQERMYTEHQTYDQENIYNQILLKGLSILSKFVSNATILDQINRILFNFPQIEEVPIKESDFDRLVINRKTEPYQEALKIAKMIILNYSPDIRSGQQEMIALLFDMNKLWEEYVYRMLLRATDDSLKVKYNQSKKFWEGKTIRPDIEIIKKEGGSIKSYIIDTKWKIIDQKSPADNDLKQMFAYNLLWEADKSMLLYPSNKIIDDEKFGDYKYHPVSKLENGEYRKSSINQCKIGFINVLNDNDELDLEIGTRIFEKLDLTSS
jgi:5-methylcytosine-specific restriction enzyme subunit McrC